jgi:hypothetical protein
MRCWNLSARARVWGRAVPRWLWIAFTTYAASVLASPTITGVTGNLADGATVTISGSGFGSAGPNVLIFDDFESGNGQMGKAIPLTSPSVGEWSGYTTDGRPNYSSFARSGTHGFRIVDPAHSDGNRLASFTKLMPSPATEVFVSYAILVPPGTNFSGASAPGVLPQRLSTWKGLWLFDGPTGYTGNGTSDMVVPSWASFWVLGGNSGAIVDAGFGDWFSFKSWNRFSVWLKANSASPVLQSGTIFVQTASPEKGHAEHTWTDRAPFQGPTSHNNPPSSGKWDRFTVPGWFGNGDQTNNQMTYDDVYVAVGPNSAARVEIGDAPTYMASRNLAISTPQTWSDGKIVFTLRAGPFSDFSKAYLYVVDGNNKVSGGYPLRQHQQVPTPPGAVLVK